MLRDEVVIERVDDPKPVRSGKPRRRERAVVDVGHVEFAGVSPETSAKLQRRLGEAAAAFRAERFADAERLLASIERLAPGEAEVYELRGLTQYRLGHWNRALADLETFAAMTGSTEQHPVIADCYRGLGRWQDAEQTWRDLRDASPGAEIVEEGRIVQAGGLADRGRVAEAIRLLDRAPAPTGQPQLHHLRRWYALADLYERAGELSRARRLFAQIATARPDFGDAAERAAAVG
ncbi:MAG: tetratricopeptide repeat protein [Acidimicrobiales bacterium]